MKTTQNDFHPMRGHVIDGMQIIMRNKDVLMLKSSLTGWRIFKDGRDISGFLKSAWEVDGFIFNYS